MVYRVNRDPIIDNNKTLRVDRMRVGSFSQRLGFQGTTSAYASGGGPGTPFPSNVTNIIDKFPFSNEANVTDVGDLTKSRYRVASSSSSSHGYTVGGRSGGNPYNNDEIDKFPFSSDGNATDVGDLTEEGMLGAGNSSTTHGYRSGADTPPSADPSGPPISKTIDKFSFASDGNATDVGDLEARFRGGTGASSLTDGYVIGGGTYGPHNPPDFPAISIGVNIRKFPFASDGNSTSVGTLAVSMGFAASNVNSVASGYGVGTLKSPITTNSDIQKFPFANESSSTVVGTLERSGGYLNGASSNNGGYVMGGTFPPYANAREINKFPFVSDGTAVDVGNLTTDGYTRQAPGGHHV